MTGRSLLLLQLSVLATTATVLLTSNLQGVGAEQAEFPNLQDAPTESQCRPYIEKALKELGTTESTSGTEETEGQSIPTAAQPDEKFPADEPSQEISEAGQDQESQDIAASGETTSVEETGGEITSIEEETPGQEDSTTAESQETLELGESIASRETQEDSDTREKRDASQESKEELTLTEESGASPEEIALPVGDSTEDATQSKEEPEIPEETSKEEATGSTEEEGTSVEEAAGGSIEEDVSAEQALTGSEEGIASIEEGTTSAEEQPASAEESAEGPPTSAEEGADTAEGVPSAEEDTTSIEEADETKAVSEEEDGGSAQQKAPSGEDVSREEIATSPEVETGASTEDVAASAEEAAPQSEEIVAEEAPAVEESTASGEELPSAEEDAEGIEAPPSEEEGAESAEASPSAEEGVESTEAPSAEEGAESAEAPPSAEESAKSAEALPSAEEGTESAEAPPSAEEGARSVEAPPSAEEGAESVEAPPSAEEGAASAEAPSSVEEVAESSETTTSAEEGAKSTETLLSAEEGAESAEAPPSAEEDSKSEAVLSTEGGDKSAEGISSTEEEATGVSTEETASSAEETQATSAEREVPSTEDTLVASKETVASEEEAAAEKEAPESTEEPAASPEDTTASAEEVVPEAPTEGEEISSAEVPEEELTLGLIIPENLRPRDHIAQIFKLDSESAERELLLAKTVESTLKELKKVYDNAIKPLEVLYKYRDLSNRHFGDPEIFSKPLILFMGPWSGGKSSIINYLLDIEYKQTALRTGAEPSPAYFNILMWGDREEVIDGTQLAADWTFSGLQKFGQGLLDRLRGLRLTNNLLEKVNIVEIPGILEIRKQVERLFPFNDACQWFIDRADIIFLVYDPAKLDVGPETEAILDQLKGREYQTRIILNKADQVRPEELMRVQGTLIWNISPLMSSSEPPVMYSTSLWSLPYEAGAPIRLLQAQERAFLRDMRTAIDKRVENKIASARRFAVRVRNHAKMVDCYLTTYYNHKGFFGNRKKVSDDIIERPQDYHIYEGLSTLTNISRYDLPDPDVYRDFFRLNPLYDFQQLSATCTYFRGCPINRLDIAIAYDLPELVGKYKKSADEVLASQQPSKS